MLYDLPMRKFVRGLLLPALILAFLALPASSFASGLSVSVVTWDILGVKSNNTGLSTGPGPGFPVGVKVCNTTGSAVSDVETAFAFTSANSYISVSGLSTDTIGSLSASGSPGDCAYSYYSIDVSRVSAARGTNRSYQITAYDNTGGPATVDGTTGTRTLYVQSLIAQNRNTTHKISGPGGCNADYTVCDPAPTNLVVGQTYTYKLYAETSTGYEQVESFLSLPTGIFRTESVTAEYQTPAGAVAQTPYADACGWTMNGALADFGSCTGPVVAPWTGGKAGNKMVLTYQLTVLNTGSGSMNSLIYDFSGGSFHYNTDFGDPSKSISFTSSVKFPLDVTVTGTGQVTSTSDPAQGAQINCGTVNVSCEEEYDQNAEVTLTATEDGTNDFNALASDCPGTGWTLASGVDQNETFTCVVTMDQARSATAIFAGPNFYPLNVQTTGAGGVTADLGTINCSITQTDCGYGYQSGNVVTLTATPDSGNAFDVASSVCPGSGWTTTPFITNGSPTVYYCQVNMDAAKDATAVFDPVLPTVYSLTAEVTGGTGTITSTPGTMDCDQTASPVCADSFNEGTSVTLTATPGPGQEYKTGVCPGTGWTPVGDGTYTCVVTMTEAKNATVAFQTPQQTVTASVTAGRGSITSDPSGIDCDRELIVTVAAAGEDCVKTYDENTSVTLTATPDSGQEFDSGVCPGTGWTAVGDGSYTCVVVMSEFREVKAAFKAKATPPTPPTPPNPPTEKFKLSVTLEGSGSITGSGIDCGSTCSKDFDAGSKVTLTAKPSEGYKFDSGSCPGEGWTAVGDGSYTCSVTMDKAKDATAKFVKVEPKLELEIKSNDKTVKKGDVITVSLDLKNTGTGEAKDTEACMTIPSGFALVKAAKGAKVKGSLVCWPTGDVAPGSSEKRWVKLRVITASSERVTFRGAATAANAAGSKVDAKAKTRVKVKKSKKKPRPVTG